MREILKVEDLKMHYRTKKGDVKAVDGITLSIKEGKALGLVGESGCGKTSLGLTILGILPSNAKIKDGKILFFDNESIVKEKGYIDLIKIKREELRNIRWKEISMIFQYAMNAFNPVYKVGDQIIEAMKYHENNLQKEEARQRVSNLFNLVGLEPERMDDYPHQFSGGMKQRAIIAMALSSNPNLVIADEPTTALDVIVQDQILREIKKIQEKLHMSMLFISHDFSVVAEVSDSIAIMYAGKLVEHANANKILKGSLHPYTKALIKSFLTLRGQLKRFDGIPGEPPSLIAPVEGCRFYPRCPYRTEFCKKKEPQYKEVENEHYVACHKV
jgi:peptide/nickel transport system ATP-binding protein